MVHSDSTAVVLLQKHLIPDLALTMSIVTNCVYAAMSKPNVLRTSAVVQVQLIMSVFCSIPIVFHQFFTWIALGDIDLCFSCQ